MIVLGIIPQLSLRRRFGALAVATLVNACAPPTPRIDGVAGAPVAPSTPWTVPAEARTPPPPAPPLAVPQATAAMRADSAAVGGTLQLAMGDVIDIALRNNPATRESWATARAAADQYGAARGALFPTINGSVVINNSGTFGSNLGGNGLSNNGTGNGTGTTGTGTGTGTGIDTTGGRGGTGGTNGSSFGSSTRTVPSASLSLSYLVFDLGGRAGTIESAKQLAIASNLAHNTTIQNVVLEVESALFSYLATRAIRDAELVSVHEAETDTAAAEARLRVGVGTLEEVLQTRTELAQARFQLATDEGSLVAARGTLAATMGFPANSRFDVPEIATSDSVGTVSVTVDTLINRAITERPDLAEARAEAAALAAEIRVARSAGYPALTLSSTATYQRPLQGASSGVSSRSYSVVLGLQIPIFNGFSHQYDARAAQAQYEAGLARITSTLQQITVQVFTSYAALQTATQRVNASEELLRSATQSSDVALGRYREGVGTIVDVLLARSALASARAEEIQARWEWRTSLAQLAHDVGTLDLNGRPNIPLISLPGGGGGLHR